MTASRIFLISLSELADYASRKTVIVHNYRRGNENTAGLSFPAAGICPKPRPDAPATADFGQIWRSSYYPRGFVAPIAVAQQPLVELAGRQPRQFVLEIDRARHLLARQRLAAEQNQLFGQVGAGH